MKLGTGIGVAALIISIIGAFIPFVGLFIGWLALVIALIATLCGDKGLSIAVVIWSAFVFVFLTPTLWMDAGVAGQHGAAPFFVWASVVFVVAPIIGMMMFSSGKLVLARQHEEEDGTKERQA